MGARSSPTPAVPAAHPADEGEELDDGIHHEHCHIRMTLLSSIGLHPGCEATMPPVVEELLMAVVKDGFVVYCCGGRAEPTALVASYEWERCVDIVTIRGLDWVIAARVPRRVKLDIFAPEVVVWAYEGSAEWALRALLNLVHPQHPHAPTTTYPAPRSLHVPRNEQRPLTIRPSSPDRASVRARRLAAAITSEARDFPLDETPL